MPPDRPTFHSQKAKFEMYGKQVLLETFKLPPIPGEPDTDDFLIFSCESIPIVVLALTDDSEVLVLEHYRYTKQGNVLELPGGTDKPSTSTLDVVEIELKEETGYKAREVTPLSDAGYWFDPASVKVQFRPFLATGCQGVGEPVKARNEFYTVVCMPWSDWIRKINSGEVTDSKSIVTTIAALKCVDRSLRQQAVEILGN